MKLSISNIAWTHDDDYSMYKMLSERNISGLEIAPTRIWKDTPYEHIEEAKNFANMLLMEYGLEISSMQSIWFGITENIFTSEESRQRLIEYTKKAIDFANVIKCGNLVFGCPRNRKMEVTNNEEEVYNFFKTIGDYAFEHQTRVALEANPAIYNTNFINTTNEALAFVKKIDSKGLLVNYDLGTCIVNGESLVALEEDMEYLNHIHISEPNLELIKKRKIHNAIAEILKTNKYNGYVSLEMKMQDNKNVIIDSIEYLREVFQ